MHNFSDVVQGKHFQIRGWMEGEKCAFSTKNWSYLGNGERYSQSYY